MIDKIISVNPENFYRLEDRRAGDLFFSYRGGNVGHANMIAADASFEIDSDYGARNGADLYPMRDNWCDGIVFGFKSRNRAKNYSIDAAYRAANIAESWCEETEFSNNVTNTGQILGGGRPERQTQLALGAAGDGRNASARVRKHLHRDVVLRKEDAFAKLSAEERDRRLDQGEFSKAHPKDETCAEMTILAYQSALPDEKTDDFLQLDAHHASPPKSVRCLIGNPNWEFVGRRAVPATTQIRSNSQNHVRQNNYPNASEPDTDDEVGENFVMRHDAGGDDDVYDYRPDHRAG